MIYPHKERWLMAGKVSCWSLTVLAFMFLSCQLAIGGSRGPSGVGFFGALFWLGLGIGPHLLLRRSKRAFLREAQERHDAFVSKAGVVDYKDYANGSGIAISKSRQEITLLEDEANKTYPFSAIREWRSNLETPGRVVGFGSVAATSKAMGENLRMTLDARERSGIFIHVRDVDHPVWQVRFPNKAMIDRWFEILNQSLGEGAASGALARDQ